MVSQTPTSSELYNLRWNSYVSNLINVFTDHQTQETLVDVTLGCEGQFIKAHKLVLSACSVYFQAHTTPQLLILLNEVKFDNLKLVIQFMYKGEVKVAEQDMEQFLQLGKMLQVKGLSSVELQEKQKQLASDKKAESKDDSKSEKNKTTPEIRKSKSPQRIVLTEPKQDKIISSEPKQDNRQSPLAKKRKLPSPAPPDSNAKKPTSPSTENKEITHIPRPPNAFMIFANQWRKKLATQYPNDSNKDISVRLGNMWKCLTPETKNQFYEDAKKADEEHKLKYPGYYYSPKEARHRKVIATICRNVKDPIATNPVCDEAELIEIKCEDDDIPTNDTD